MITVWLAGAPAASAAGWAVEPVPSPVVHNGQLVSISCTSATACSAVGYAGQSASQTLAERWDGTAWSIQATPNPNRDALLNAVSCASSTSCMAVGLVNNSGQQALAELWNGTSWSVLSVPSPGPSSDLVGVSCASETDCTVVGSYGNGNGQELALAETWNGSTWSIDTAQNPSDAGSTVQLSGVSCTAADACTAVGLYETTSFVQQTLAERFNGNTWSVQATPDPPGASAVTLAAVSCTSATACIAVGSSSSGTLAERWNGQAWSIQTTPDVGSARTPGFNAVSCTSASACIAVGSGDGPLAESFNGRAWSVQSTPSPSGASFSALDGLSCAPLQSTCIAVGFETANGNQAVLAEQMDSSGWSLQAVPSPGEAANAQLSSVSCASVASCAAVGSAAVGTGSPIALAELWNGGAWSIEPMPVPEGSASSALSSVSCTSSDFCAAVGGYCDAQCNGRSNLVELWNGSSWVTVPSPNVPGMTNGLSGVSCTSATACTAVGGANAIIRMRPVRATVIERWDGTSWAMQTPPNINGAGLGSVSCTSATDCTAVDGAGAAVVWNGSNWSAQTTSDPNGVLSGVSCTSATACTTVGYDPRQTGDTPVAERSDGSNWSTEATPSPSGSQGSRLYGVSCASASACTAVGYGTGTLAEAWDGTGWSIEATANPSDANGYTTPQMLGISCTPATACMAVGNYTDTTGNGRPLAELYQPPQRQAANVTVVLSPTSIVADGHSQTTATARSTNRDGNPVAGEQVAFSTSDAGETIGSVTDHGDGTYTALITASTAPGDVTIVATDSSVSPSASGQATLTQTVLPSSPIGSGGTRGGGSGGGSGSGVSIVLGHSGSGSRRTGSPTSRGRAVAFIGLGHVHGLTVSAPVHCVGAAGARCWVRLTLSVTESFERGKMIAVSATKSKRQITRKVVVIATVTIRLKAGHSRIVSLTIDRTGRRLLAARHKLTVALRFTARYVPRSHAAKAGAGR